jgi:hypothetical protein
LSFLSNPYTGTVGTPPFIGVPTLPHIPGTPYGPEGIPSGSGPSVTSPDNLPGGGPPTNVPGPYSPGPFCFGLDSSICGNLPESTNVGVGPASIDIPVREICKATTNVVCGLLVAAILVVILGVALQGLLT